MKEKTVNSRRVKIAFALFSISLLAGCTSIPEDLGRNDVDEIIRDSTGLEQLDRSRELNRVLENDLTVDTSVRIALLKNPQLRAKMAELGFGAADVYQAARIRNPILSASVFDSTEPGSRDQITFGLVASFTDLLTLGKRSRLAKAEYAALRQHVAHEAIVVVKNAQSSYHAYAAAREIAELRDYAAYSADVSFRLAQRFFDAGNITSRELNIAAANAVEAKLASLSANANEAAARAELAAILGLDASLDWQLDSGIKIPIGTKKNYDELLAQAQTNRLDFSAAKAAVDQIAEQHGLTQWSRWIDEFELGYERERETDGKRLGGPTLDWALPLISQNRDQVLRVQARLEQAIVALDETGLRISNEVWLGHQALLNAAERLELLASRLLPARMQATRQAQEEEAFMLIGVFEVLDSKQQEFDAIEHYIESLKDYWVAHAELSYAVGKQLDREDDCQVFKFSDQLSESANDHQHHHNHNAKEAPVEDKHEHQRRHEGSHH